MAAILDFGGNIEIIKIMYSSVFVLIFKKQTFWHITWLCKLITSPVVFDLRFWAAILVFCGHIEVIKIAYCNQIRYLFKQRTFWHITRLCKSIISPVMFVLRFLAAIFVFFGRHFENRGLNFAAREKKWCIHPKETTLQFWCFCPACNKIDKKSF